ncbi:hypothetical protein V8E53_006204 [Lactarius tabidus]
MGKVKRDSKSEVEQSESEVEGLHCKLLETRGAAENGMHQLPHDPLLHGVQHARALVHRLKEIVDFVKGLGRDVAVIENGKCVWTPSRSPRPPRQPDRLLAPQLSDLEDTFALPYLHLCEYLDDHCALTKFCISQFKGRKSANKALRNAAIKPVGYADLDALVKDWTGNDEFDAIKAAIDARATAPPILLPAAEDDTISSPPPASHQLLPKSCGRDGEKAPGWHGNSDPAVVHGAPLLPTNERRIPVPAGIPKRDPGTPTPFALPSRTDPASVSNGTLPIMTGLSSHTDIVAMIRHVQALRPKRSLVGVPVATSTGFQAQASAVAG